MESYLHKHQLSLAHIAPGTVSLMLVGSAHVDHMAVA